MGLYSPTSLLLDPNNGKKIMISSVAIMNDSYLSKKSDAQKLVSNCNHNKLIMYQKSDLTF